MSMLQAEKFFPRKGTTPELKIPEEVLESWQTIIETMKAVAGITITLSINNEYKKNTCSCEEPLKNSGVIKFSAGAGRTDNPEESGRNCFGFPILWPFGEVMGNLKIYFHESFTDLNKKKNEKKILNAIKKSMEADLGLIHNNASLKAVNDEMRYSLLEKLNLDSLPVICSYCKKIKNREDYWNRIDQFFHTNYKINFSHGICPECSDELMKEING